MPKPDYNTDKALKGRSWTCPDCKTTYTPGAWEARGEWDKKVVRCTFCHKIVPYGV